MVTETPNSAAGRRGGHAVTGEVECVHRPRPGGRPVGHRSRRAVAEAVQLHEVEQVFGARADARTLDDYAAAGITRAILPLPPADRDTVWRALDRYQPLLDARGAQS